MSGLKKKKIKKENSSYILPEEGWWLGMPEAAGLGRRRPALASRHHPRPVLRIQSPSHGAHVGLLVCTTGYR